MRRLRPVVVALPALLTLALSALAVPAPAVPAAAPAALGPPTAATALTTPDRRLTVDGATVGFRVLGRGRPLVLVMGLGGSMDAWPPSLVDALVGAGRRVVLVDNEGVGRSAVRPGPLTIRRMGETTAALMRRLRLGRADVVGWSMGGMIGQSLAVRHPRQVRRLALLATAPGDGTFVPPSAAVLGAFGTSDTAALIGRLFADPAVAPRYAAELLRRPGAAPAAPATAVTAQVAATATWLGGGDPSGKAVTRLRLPVLIMGGAADQILPVGNQRHLAGLVHGARLRIYRAAGHGFFYERPEAVTALRAFLGR